MRVPARSNTVPHGQAGGTMGGRQGAGTMHNQQTATGGMRPGSRPLNVGDAKYLWILVALEVGATVWFRQATRRHHGG